MNALRAGALAVLRKPAGPASPDFEKEAQQFVRTARAMAGVKVVRHRPPMPPPGSTPATGRPPYTPRTLGVRAVAIAASTGGPAALHAVLSRLPKDFAAPILVVQHMAKGFTAGFAEWLSSAAAVPVSIASEGEALESGRVYVAPDDRHLGVTASRKVALSLADPVGGFRPSATYLFREVARVYGTGALAVVLTGMGTDGLDGLADVRAGGGYVVAQDEDSSVVFGMPGAAVAAGLANEVLPLASIPQLLREVAT
jgi:two-component system chemotaxis response regulator CheB